MKPLLSIIWCFILLTRKVSVTNMYKKFFIIFTWHYKLFCHSKTKKNVTLTLSWLLSMTTFVNWMSGTLNTPATWIYDSTLLGKIFHLTFTLQWQRESKRAIVHCTMSRNKTMFSTKIGNQSGLRVTVVLGRRLLNVLLTVFLPTILLSVKIAKNKPPAGAKLIVTSGT